MNHTPVADLATPHSAAAIPTFPLLRPLPSAPLPVAISGSAMPAALASHASREPQPLALCAPQSKGLLVWWQGQRIQYARLWCLEGPAADGMGEESVCEGAEIKVCVRECIGGGVGVQV